MSSEQNMTETSACAYSLQQILDLCSFTPLEMMHIRDRQIRGISLNSGACRPGYVYFAVPGLQYDGHDFISEAVQNGAETVFYTHAHPDIGKCRTVSYIKTDDIRKALSEFSAVHYGHPSSDMLLIGITGTDGKSTTAYFLFQLLNLTGIRTGLISGVYRGTADSLQCVSGLTTPESHEIHKLLHQFREKQCRAAVIEVSSHALSEQQKRADHIAFDGFIFTPITRDHFDYHGSLSEYIRAKLRSTDITFTNFRFKNQRTYCGAAQIQEDRKKPFCIFSLSNPAAEDIFLRTRNWTRITAACRSSGQDQEQNTAAAKHQYADFHHADYHCAALIDRETSRMTACWNGKESCAVSTEYMSAYQLEDLTLAMGALHQAAEMIGCSIPRSLLPKLEKVPGRHTVLEICPNRIIVIDYAHTPAAVTSLLKQYRSSFPRHRLITLTGAAGNRDSGKRALMAAEAEAYSDVLIFTTEDPCSEKQIDIFSDLRSGITGRLVPGRDIFFVSRRRTAISLGISRMDDCPSSSVLFLLGKGHEKTIRTADGPLPWNELEETLSIIELQGKSRYDISVH